MNNQHTDEIREAFEAEAAKYWNPKPDFMLRDDGEYENEDIGNAYYFWQAAALNYKPARRGIKSMVFVFRRAISKKGV